MTEFEIFIIATSIVQTLIIIYTLNNSNLAKKEIKKLIPNQLGYQDKEFKTKRKKDTSVKIPKKLRVYKNK